MRRIRFGILILLFLSGSMLANQAWAGASIQPNVSGSISAASRGGWVGALNGNRNYAATISGTRFAPANPLITGLNYPGACRDLGLGTYAAHANAAVKDTTVKETCCGSCGTDCLDYAPCIVPTVTPWHVIDDTDPSVPSSQRPAILRGHRSLWCGKYNSAWVNPVGYANRTQEMLYVDTGTHAAAYTFRVVINFSSENSKDFVYLIGGGNGNTDPDPLGADWDRVDEAIASGLSLAAKRLVTWTGNYRGNDITLNTTSGPQSPAGSANQGPTSLTMILTIAAEHRGLYFVFVSDNENSSVSGWGFGHGQVMDSLRTSDNGVIFGEDVPLVGVSDGFGGTVLKGTSMNPVLSARTRPPSTMCFALLSSVPNGDPCTQFKNSPTDSQWVIGQPLPAVVRSMAIESCSFPIPPGTGSLLTTWSHYLDLPQASGNVEYVEYRCFKNGSWLDWKNTNPSGAVRMGAEKAWLEELDEITEGAQSDSVQLRYWVECVPSLSADGQTCQLLNAGLIYDNFGLYAVSGVSPAPTFGVFPGWVAQTTFVDGSMAGVNCTSTPCWPGIRGSDLGPGTGIDDNVNSAVGDSLVVRILSPFRTRGMGVNWRQGFDKTVLGGTVITHSNASYNAALGTPRVIYRLFDPTTKTWSPFDSTELDADDVAVGSDTTVVAGAFRMDWPPRDKVGLSLPGGFTIKGVSAYNSLKFLPRGTRMQYYFKAVDIQGNVAYQFQADAAATEVEDLPSLPGGLAQTPDIIEFDVLPRVYAAGSVGSLLAGKTSTPVLNLDGSYSAWSDEQDPVTQALRGLGVRADRYRLLQAIGYGSNVGGHELTGAPDNQRPRRLSNYFPNMTEYPIRESLATWYRILIQSGHVRTSTLDDEQDAKFIEDWWNSSTGTNGGDRCLFVSGDDYFNGLLNMGAEPAPRRTSLGQNVLGVNSVTNQWNGSSSIPYPVLDDRFANPSAGPGLVAGYTNPVDGGCPGPNRFDAFTKIGPTTAQNSAFYPTFSGITNVAAVAMQAEKDPVTDNDRNKALSYGYSIQFVRKAGIPTTAANYVHSGVQERMQILYKFLASCRGARGVADSVKCWPCPTDANMAGNWATLPGFQTGVYGPLYPIQDNAAATGVEVSQAPRPTNLLQGNFPNPFNPQTTIRFSSATTGQVTIRIFNVGGQLVRTLSTKVDTGMNEVRWNGRRDDGVPLASGVYFYRVRFADGSESGSRMALVK